LILAGGPEEIESFPISIIVVKLQPALPQHGQLEASG
jgi:hypothetical protein